MYMVAFIASLLLLVLLRTLLNFLANHAFSDPPDFCFHCRSFTDLIGGVSVYNV